MEIIPRSGMDFLHGQVMKYSTELYLFKQLHFIIPVYVNVIFGLDYRKLKKNVAEVENGTINNNLSEKIILGEEKSLALLTLELFPFNKLVRNKDQYATIYNKLYIQLEKQIC